MNISETVLAQKEFFLSGATLPTSFRKKQLRKLQEAVKAREGEICAALWEELHKSPEEAFMTETSIVLSEIRNQLRHLDSWAKPRRVRTPLAHFPSRSRILTEPRGTVLIVSPWNYPVQLLLNPLVGAIAAGCTAVLKTSPLVPKTSALLKELLESCFESNYIAVFEGHREVNEELFAQRFDLIFLTGSPGLGKAAMAAAARNLTPVVLELGGKSPCIVDRDADPALAARRIAWGKTLNAGQTCIAPDYVFVHEELKERFAEGFRNAVSDLHQGNSRESANFGRMISPGAWKRVVSYLSQGKVLAGGASDEAERYIEPTLLEIEDATVPVMQEEIFGPVLPLMTFRKLSEVRDFVNSREKPLAMYFFGNEKKGLDFASRCTSGGLCINDTIMHIANHNLPFGGVGNSGMGAYHGRDSFLAFSHRRSVSLASTRIDLPFRYPPYRFFSLVRRLLK